MSATMRVRKVVFSSCDIPFVRVETIEVDRFRSIFATSEVVLQHRAETGDISSSVANRDLAIILFCGSSVLLIRWFCKFATHHRGTPSCHEQQL
jgi:hypothetical protein